MAKHAPQSLRIKGLVGELEALWVPPIKHKKHAAILCHPLPTAGGTMHNKVIHTMSQVFASSGMGVMRFNTRGTGTSEGCYDHGKGEVHDLYSIVDYVKQQGITRLWLGGFSFGSFIAFSFIAQKPELVSCVEHLVIVNPPVTRFDYTTSTLFPFPVTLIQGEADEIVDPQQVFAWAQQPNVWLPHIDLLKFSHCGHFFHGKLIMLRERLTQQLATHHPTFFGNSSVNQSS